MTVFVYDLRYKIKIKLSYLTVLTVYFVSEQTNLFALGTKTRRKVRQALMGRERPERRGGRRRNHVD